MQVARQVSCYSVRSPCDSFPCNRIDYTEAFYVTLISLLPYGFDCDTKAPNLVQCMTPYRMYKVISDHELTLHPFVRYN